MKKLLLLPFVLLFLTSCVAQKNDKKLNSKTTKKASKGAVVINLFQAKCNDKQKIKDDKTTCKDIDNISKSVSKKLLVRDLPPIPDPCMEGNCNINFNKSRFLRSYFIEKYASIEIKTKDGELINKAEKFISAGIEGLPNATYIVFSKPLSNKGILTIKGFAEELGGEFTKNINLENLK